jgi:hypothetical protein
MKTTLSKFAVTSVASLAVLGSVAVVEPASAATITSKNTELTGLLSPLPDPFGVVSCNAGLVESATQCVGVFQGNNDVTNGGPADPATQIVSSGVFDGITDWTFSGKKDLPSGGTSTNVLGFSISPNQGNETGTFSFSNNAINWSLTSLAISLKGSTSYSIYYIPKGTFTSAPTGLDWNTLGLQTGGNNPKPGPGLSHASVYYNTVPTPALLPGLIGMGVAALRKRKAEAEDNTAA